MYFLKSLALLSLAAAGLAAPYNAAAPISAHTIANSTLNDTAPLVTPGVRARNFIPMYRRQAPAATSSLCVNLPPVSGCVGPNGKGSGNLPAVTSALSSFVPGTRPTGVPKAPPRLF